MFGHSNQVDLFYMKSQTPLSFQLPATKFTHKMIFLMLHVYPGLNEHNMCIFVLREVYGLES